MHQVIAEVEQMGALDPAAQQRLLADLKQTDPALWPLLVQQFRAALAYRQRSQQPETAGAEKGTRFNLPERPGGCFAQIKPGPFFGSVAQTAMRPGPAETQLARLPMANNAALPPTDAPAKGFPTTASPRPDGPAAEASPAEPPTAPPAPDKTPGPVVAASYNPPVSRDWQGHLRAAIEDLEVHAADSPKSPAEIAQHAHLRLLYLVANRREDAVRPIPGLAAPMQDFWSKELCGLSVSLNVERVPELRRRAAEAKRHLVEAASSLGESAPLVARNLAFCSAVQSFGSIKEFKRYEFTPNQEVLLYAEVENFSTEETPKGFHTALRSSYQIFDSQGRRVDGHEFATTTEDYCRGQRHDFFIGYHLRMPKRIYPGEHTLQLTIEDLKSQKIGQSSITFTIK